VLLEVHELSVGYSGLTVVHEVSFEVGAGEVVALLGANGAGKTTIMAAVSGLLRPSAGTVRLDGEEITRLPAHRIVGLGLRHVPEGRRIFAPLTVDENLRLGAYSMRRERRLLQLRMEDVFGHFPVLEQRRRQMAGTLSGGEQQMLALGRALMTSPKLLALDEPSLGLSPRLSHELIATTRRLADAGTGVLLVEQNAHEALRVADRAYVLEQGRIAMAGPAAEIAGDPRIQATYLGADVGVAEAHA
jgi:branched-chain amino acid transport system ATP-binding protein